jgi:2-polyprenyl-6-hydroxyphenyl methylase/3-demethylubiquinone-9 3-methyltransferase
MGLAGWLQKAFGARQTSGATAPPPDAAAERTKREPAAPPRSGVIQLSDDVVLALAEHRDQVDVKHPTFAGPARGVFANVPQPVCPTQATCKCCGAIASLFGVVDFHKNCEIVRRKVLDVSGIPIYYYRCPACQFLFTTAFDHFTQESFARYVYNEEYALVDPDYQDARPRGNADMVCRLFAASRPRRVLDYGGGNGLLAELLRAAGFAQADTYDPFVPRFATRPLERYDSVVSFEVAEHATDPARTFAEMNDLVANPGLILFSTLLQPANLEEQGLNWWYAGPRNGHVSLYTRASLEALARPLGLTLGSFNDGLHVLFRALPDFARGIMRAG